MNLYKQAMLLRYYKYDLKTARKKITAHRIIFFTLTNISNFLYSKTKDLSFLFLSYYFLMEQFNSFRNLEIYSNEYYDLKNMYDDIIEKYNEDINKTFDFTNPIEVAQAFNFAFKAGFLSKDCLFSYSNNNKELIENSSILGASIFTGKGCCRHSSRLLSDILNDYGFNSTTISTGFNSVESIEFDGISMSMLDLVLSLATSILEFDNDNINENEIFDSLSNLFHDKSTIREKWKYDRENVPRNHSIVGVSHDGLSYYIDSTNDEYYRMNNEIGRLVNEFDNIENTIKNGIFETTNDRRKVKKITSLPAADFDFIIRTSGNTNKLLSENFDVFEKFYNDNHEAYEEITEKLKKINM